MILDLFCIALGFLFAVFGYFTGFLAQAVKIVALLAGYIAAGLLSPKLGTLLGVTTGNEGPAVFISFGIAWLLSYFILAWLLGMMVGVAKNASDSLNDADKTTGMIFGGIKGLLLGLGFIASLLFFQKALTDSWPMLPTYLEESIAAQKLQTFSYFRNNSYLPLPPGNNAGDNGGGSPGAGGAMAPSGLLKAYMDGGVYTIDGQSSTARQAPDRARKAIQMINNASDQRVNSVYPGGGSQPRGSSTRSVPKNPSYSPPPLANPSQQQYPKWDTRYRSPKDRKYVPPGYAVPNYKPPSPPRPPTHP